MTVFNATPLHAACTAPSYPSGPAPSGSPSGSCGVGAARPAAQGSCTPIFVAQIAPATAPTPSIDPAKQLPGTISRVQHRLQARRRRRGPADPALQRRRRRARPAQRGSTRDHRRRQRAAAGEPAEAAQRHRLRHAGAAHRRARRRQRHPAGARTPTATYESMAYQTGNEYVVEIVPRAARRQARRRRPRRQAPRPCDATAAPTAAGR